jgi:hypothetical protein
MLKNMEDQMFRTKSKMAGHLTSSELLCEFPQLSHTALYKIIPVRLDYHKFCVRWLPKIFTGAYKKQRMGSALLFFSEIPQWWWWISVSHHGVTGDECWVSFVNAEAKEQ